jgi:hypothetical protein
VAKPALSGERILVRTGDGLAVLDSVTGRRVGPAAALTTSDGKRLVNVDADGRVVVRAAATGDVVAATAVRGQLRLAAVAPDGGLVALVEGDPAGRQQTTIVVAGPTGERHRLTLPGFVQPEAFSSSGTGLFVLDMLPPEHPDRYRVRVLDLAAGKLSALNLVGDDAGVKVLVPEAAEEEMRGEGRQAVFDAARERLFTLYSHQPDHQHVRDLLNPGARDGKPDVHAFVHTLSVRDGWAVCVDLPATFGTGAVEGLTIAQNAAEVWVADAGKGVLAVIQPDALVVIQELSFAATAGPAALAAGPDRVFLAVGRWVFVFDAAAEAKRAVATWELPGEAKGVAVSAGHVYVGQPDAVLRLDPASGAVTAIVRSPGLVGVQRVIG